MKVFASIIIAIVIIVIYCNKKSKNVVAEVKEESTEQKEKDIMESTIMQSNRGSSTLEYFNSRLQILMKKKYGEMLANVEYYSIGPTTTPYFLSRFEVKILLKNGTTEYETLKPEEVWGIREKEEAVKIEVPEDNTLSRWIIDNIGNIDQRIRAAANAGFSAIDYPVDESILTDDVTIEEIAEAIQKNNSYVVTVRDKKLNINFAATMQEYLDD